MAPTELRARVRAAILAQIDGDIWEESLEREEEERDKLASRKDRILEVFDE